MPLLFLIAGAAALAFILSKESPPATDSSGNLLCDNDMSDDMCKAVNIALRTEKDPQRLRSFAATIPQFPIASGALLAKAVALEIASGLLSSLPADIPPAPPPLPPINPLPQTLPSVPPAFIPDNPPSPPFPSFTPPGSPAAPAAPAAVPAEEQFFDPTNGGPMPRLPVIPSSGATVTEAHKGHQRALVEFYKGHDVVDASGKVSDAAGNIQYGPEQVDGRVGPKTQIATWGFQSWANRFRGAGLTLDGLPGTNTAAALAEFSPIQFELG